MSQSNVYFDEEEETIISDFKYKWKISKQEVIKKIIREFKEKEND